MEHLRTQAIEAAAYLKQAIDRQPDAGVLAGTGLSDTLTALDITHRFPYETIPHFPVSTVESHKGQLCFGTIADRFIMMLQGRFHLYEGYSPSQVTFPVRVMQEMGVQTLILSNAAGGVNLDFTAGDIMIIHDHINLTGKNPLTGPNEDDWGVRFPDMTQVYSPGLIQLAHAAAAQENICIQKGVYAGLTGPSLETPAETRFLKAVGCDAVGFSTVMEAIAGVHAGMDILGVSMITNINNPDAPEKTTLDSVLETAQKASIPFGRLLGAVLSRI